MFKIGFLGAAGEVTGSCFVVDLGDEQILVDCGMFQGQSFNKNADSLRLDIDKLVGVVVTHGHLDHCGRLPLLVKDRTGRSGYDGNFMMTKPSKEIIDVVLRDVVKIAKNEGMRNGRKGPLYEVREVERVIANSKVYEYGQWFEIGRHAKARFWDAGHILGSASVEMVIGSRRVIFSGDLGNEPSPLVGRIEAPETADIVVMESTYGGRNHEERGGEKEILSSLCQKISRTKGTLLIPAFSIERTQEMLHIFDHLKKEGLVDPAMVVYLDSPMATKVTKIFTRYPEYFSKELTQHWQGDDPFDFSGLVVVDKNGQSDRVVDLDGPKVVIAGSGMMSGGRIMKHAKRWLSDQRTELLLTGFQAVGTLGRELEEGKTEVSIDRQRVLVKARVSKCETMSAHADNNQLLDWFARVEGVKQLFLVHGENEARESLAKQLVREKMEIVMPEYEEIYEVV